MPLGSVITLAEDGAQSTVTMACTEANVSDVVSAYSFDESDPPDGFQVEYREPTNGKQAFALFPSDSVTPERVVLFGCTDATTAEDFAEGLWKRRQYRRRFLTFKTELEGHLVQIGKLISFDHPTTGAVQAVVQSVTAEDEHRTTVQAFVYDARAFA